MLLTNKLALRHENLLQPSLMFASKVCVGSTLRMETLCVDVKAHKGQPECCEDFKNVQHWHRKSMPISFSFFQMMLQTNKLSLLYENLLQPSLMFASMVWVDSTLRMETLVVAYKGQKERHEYLKIFNIDIKSQWQFLLFVSRLIS